MGVEGYVRAAEFAREKYCVRVLRTLTQSELCSVRYNAQAAGGEYLQRTLARRSHRPMRGLVSRHSYPGVYQTGFPAGFVLRARVGIKACPSLTVFTVLIPRRPETVCRHIEAHVKRLAEFFQLSRPTVRVISINRKDWHAIRDAGDTARSHGFVIDKQGEEISISYKGFLLNPVDQGQPHR